MASELKPDEFTRVFVSKSTRAWIHRLKGPEKSYDSFIRELCEEYEHRSPSAKTNDTGYQNGKEV